MADGPYRGRIVETLRELEFHPEYAMGREAVIGAAIRGAGPRELLEIERAAESPEGNDGPLILNRTLALMCESTMLKPYEARVRFLEKVAGAIDREKGRLGRKPVVVDDGCGTGIDLYCIDKLFGEGIELFGREPNEHSRALAVEKNPGLAIAESYSPNGLGEGRDLVYMDFGDPGYIKSSGQKIEEVHLGLNKDGLFVVQTDVSAAMKAAYVMLMKIQFDLVDLEEVPSRRVLGGITKPSTIFTFKKVEEELKKTALEGMLSTWTF